MAGGFSDSSPLSMSSAPPYSAEAYSVRAAASDAGGAGAWAVATETAASSAAAATSARLQCAHFALMSMLTRVGAPAVTVTVVRRSPSSG